MVVVVTFDDGAEDPLADRSPRPAGSALPLPLPSHFTNDGGMGMAYRGLREEHSTKSANRLDEVREQSNPDLNVLFEALGHYPSAMTSL